MNQFRIDNILASEVCSNLLTLVQSELTSRFCLNIGGRFSNIEYEAHSVSPGVVRRHSNWETQLDMTVIPVNQIVPTGSVSPLPTPIHFKEEQLLPWNLHQHIIWPKYPHLFSVFSVPDSDWLQSCEENELLDTVYPIRAHAVKLHKGVHVMPVGVMLNSAGQHCYMLAVERGSSAFNDFKPTVLYPIGSFDQQTIPVEHYDIAGWGA